MKNQVLPTAFLFSSFEGWAPSQTSSKIGKGKKGLPELVLENSSIWKETKANLFIISLPAIFPLLYTFEKSGPSWVLEMSRSNIILRKNKLPLYFSFSTLHQHLLKLIFCSPGASAGLEAAQGMTHYLQVTSAHANNFTPFKHMFCNNSASIWFLIFFSFFLRRCYFNTFCRDVVSSAFKRSTPRPSI